MAIMVYIFFDDVCTCILMHAALERSGRTSQVRTKESAVKRKDRGMERSKFCWIFCVSVLVSTCYRCGQ